VYKQLKITVKLVKDERGIGIPDYREKHDIMA
jgi:hypothetical protein